MVSVARSISHLNSLTRLHVKVTPVAQRPTNDIGTATFLSAPNFSSTLMIVFTPGLPRTPGGSGIAHGITFAMVDCLHPFDHHLHSVHTIGASFSTTNAVTLSLVYGFAVGHGWLAEAGASGSTNAAEEAPRTSLGNVSTEQRDEEREDCHKAEEVRHLRREQADPCVSAGRTPRKIEGLI